MTKQQTVLITGANQGIGLATAKLLARKDYNITIACRNEEKARQAVWEIQSLNESITVNYLLVDLASLKSVQKFNEDIVENDRCFDVVILNAGVLLPTERRTEDGHDMTFQVNYLAQYMLANAIINNQEGRQKLRVVTLTSVLYRFCGGIFYRVEKEEKDWYEMFNSEKNSQWKTYAMSKFATAAFARNLRSKQVDAIAVHPGAVHTNLASGIGKRFRKYMSFMTRWMITTETSAEHVVACVEAEFVDPIVYSNEGRMEKLSSTVRKQRNLDALQSLSERLIQPYA